MASAAPHFTSSARPSASGSSGNLGLGIMLGEPTGLTLKNWLSSTRAFDLGVTYSFGNYFAVLGDYLFHFPGAFSSSARSDVANDFVPYLGIGAIAFFDTGSNGIERNGFFRRNDLGSSVGLGVRIPLGLEFLPRSAPIGIFAEIVPGLGVIPSTFGFIEGVVGGRFYF